MNSDAIFVFVVELSELRRSLVDESKYEVCGALAPLNLNLSICSALCSVVLASRDRSQAPDCAFAHTFNAAKRF